MDGGVGFEVAVDVGAAGSRSGMWLLKMLRPLKLLLRRSSACTTWQGPRP